MKLKVVGRLVIIITYYISKGHEVLFRSSALALTRIYTSGLLKLCAPCGALCVSLLPAQSL